MASIFGDLSISPTQGNCLNSLVNQVKFERHAITRLKAYNPIMRSMSTITKRTPILSNRSMTTKHSEKKRRPPSQTKQKTTRTYIGLSPQNDIKRHIIENNYPFLFYALKNKKAKRLVSEKSIKFSYIQHTLLKSQEKLKAKKRCGLYSHYVKPSKQLAISVEKIRMTPFPISCTKGKPQIEPPHIRDGFIRKANMNISKVDQYFTLADFGPW